jgi:ribosomal protein S18 acetylase RimI-like enzyme
MMNIDVDSGKKSFEIRSLGSTGFDTVYNAFSLAFQDYEIRLNRSQLMAMLHRRGFDPGLSFAAFDGDDITAFTLNGTGTFNGIPTAYDTGTGTLKEFRGQGLATKIFEYSIPFLKEKGVEQYLLEVLQHNTGAVSVYKNLGFEVTREFNYFIKNTNEIKDEHSIQELPFSVRQTGLDELEAASEFWDFHPSWQNGFESINRSAGEFVCLGAFHEHRLAGYCIFEPLTGDVTQIAVSRPFRRKGIGSFLLREMIVRNRNEVLKIINTEISCESITRFLASKNIEPTGRQFEMMRKF